MREKADIQNILIPRRLKILREEMLEAKKNLDSIPSSDLSENEPWHKAKDDYDVTVKNYMQTQQEAENLAFSNKVRKHTIIEYGDLLRIKDVNTEEEDILNVGIAGDPLIKGIIEASSLLGQQIIGKSPGMYSVLTISGILQTYKVDFVYKDEEDVINTFIRNFERPTEEIIKDLIETK